MSSAQEKVQKILDDACSQENGPPGLVFGMMDKKGNWLAKSAAGVRDLDKPEQPMTTDTVFAIYSCTKMLAAMAVMQVVERGQLDLDEPVEKWVPEISNIKLLDGSPAKKKITMRMLLSHTAGFGYTFFHAGLRDYCKENGSDEFDPGRWEEDYAAQPLIAQPGTDWNYSIAIDWAGIILHKITGKTLGEWSKENIFDPAGVKDLAYLSKFNQAELGRFVGMHERATDGKVKSRAHFPGAKFDSGGAGCLGTLEDYLKCIVVMVNEGKALNGAQILKPETVDEMWKDQLTEETSKGLYASIPAARPDLTNPTEVAPGMNKGWAISACLTKDPWPTGRNANSIWWAGLPNLFWMADREAGVVNMVMSQILPFGDPRTLTPWLEAEKAVYDSMK